MSRVFLTVGIVLTIATLLYGQEDPGMRFVKGFVKFDSLPGKNGKLIAGFDIEKNIPDELKDFKMSEDKGIYASNDTAFLAKKIVMRGVVFTNGEESIQINIFVAQNSINDAHEASLYKFATMQAPLENFLFRGDLVRNLNVGDFNFILGVLNGSTPEDEITNVNFVRNNVVIWIDRGWDKKKGINIISVARSIDNTLKNQPTYDTLEQSGLLPEIKEFELKHGVTEVKEQSFTELEVELKNPALKEEAKGKKDGKDKEDDKGKKRGGSFVNASGNTTAKGLLLFFFPGGSVLREETPADTPKVSNVETERLFFQAPVLRKQEGQRLIKGKIIMYTVNPKLLLAADKTIEVTIIE